MGPLAGVRVLEVGGIGPVPFCAMMLADMGADVVRIERPGIGEQEAPNDGPLLRNRRSVALELKHPEAIDALLALVSRSDILLEGFRPGVAERLGFGPDVCLARNPKLVYGRMTGWGQDGPLAQAPGHDINYIALAGALHLIGPRGGKPVPPLNLVGDFGGGAMLLGMGVLAALISARASGRGQVVDAAMVDGTAALLAMHFGFRARGWFRDATGENFLAGGAPYYDTYRTKDGKYVAIGAIEPQFFRALLGKLGLDVSRFAALGYPNVHETQGWAELREAIAAAFARRTRDEWCRILEGTDACFAPVLSLEEVASHPHNAARKTFVEVEGVLQHSPAPRFSETQPAPIRPPRRAGQDTADVLSEAGLSAGEIERLRAIGAAG
ncbi:MAG TPA: CaiB/BaiF CoA-transferase family protein [Steroidobacter sp.]